MSSFARNATEMLCAAETALGYENGSPLYGRLLASSTSSPETKEAVEPTTSGFNVLKSDSQLLASQRFGHGEVSLGEVFRRLSAATREIGELRSLLAEEREARSQLLLSLGKRWKEEVLVEVRRGDLDWRRSLAGVEGNIGESVKAMAVQLQLVQQQVADVKRSCHVYSQSRMDVEERLKDEMEELKTKVNNSTALCSNIRLECAQQLEREKSAISQRLDVELMRYNEMRRADERDVASAKAALKEEVNRLQSTIKAEVCNQWRGAAVSLEKSLREPFEELAEEMKKRAKAQIELENKVDSTLHEYDISLRTTSNLLKDRIASLESAEAVTLSRVDRAERKCDVVVDSTSKLEAQLHIAKEAVESAVAVSQRVSERIQAVESIQTDRDNRLSKLESHLRAISTAEALKAEVEACRRQVSRVESFVETIRESAEREENSSERALRQAEVLIERVNRLDRESKKSEEELKTINGQVESTLSRVADVERTVETIQHATNRQALSFDRIEQRMDAAESRHHVHAESMDKLLKEVHHAQHNLSFRIEAAQDVAARSETATTSAKAEVERIEKRFLRAEGLLSGIQSEIGSLGTKIEDYSKEMSILQRRQTQNQDWVSGREAKLDEKLAVLDEMISKSDANTKRIESMVQSQCAIIEQSGSSRTKDLEQRFNGLVQKMSDSLVTQIRDAQRENILKTTEKISEIESQLIDRTKSVEHVVDQMKKERSSVISTERLKRVEDNMAMLEERVEVTSRDVKEMQNSQRVGLQSIRNQLLDLQMQFQKVNDDVGYVTPTVHTHGRRIEDLNAQLSSLRADYRGEAQEIEEVRTSSVLKAPKKFPAAVVDEQRGKDVQVASVEDNSVARTELLVNSPSANTIPTKTSTGSADYLNVKDQQPRYTSTSSTPQENSQTPAESPATHDHEKKEWPASDAQSNKVGVSALEKSSEEDEVEMGRSSGTSKAVKDPLVAGSRELLNKPASSGGWSRRSHIMPPQLPDTDENENLEPDSIGPGSGMSMESKTNCILPGSTEAEPSQLPAEHSNPVVETERSGGEEKVQPESKDLKDFNDLTVPTKVGSSFSEAASPSLHANLILPPVENDTEEASPSSFPSGGAETLEPQTLQSLIETVSARSRSGASHRELENDDASPYDDWDDSTDAAEEEEFARVGGLEDISAVDLSHEVETGSNGEDQGAIPILGYAPFLKPKAEESKGVGEKISLSISSVEQAPVLSSVSLPPPPLRGDASREVEDEFFPTTVSALNPEKTTLGGLADLAPESSIVSNEGVRKGVSSMRFTTNSRLFSVPETPGNILDQNLPALATSQKSVSEAVETPAPRKMYSSFDSSSDDDAPNPT